MVQSCGTLCGGLPVSHDVQDCIRGSDKQEVEYWGQFPVGCCNGNSQSCVCMYVWSVPSFL